MSLNIVNLTNVDMGDVYHPQTFPFPPWELHETSAYCQKKKSLSNSQEAKFCLLKNKTAGVKPQSCHYHVQHVVWALEVKLELVWRFWVSRHAYGRFVPRPALFAVRSTNCRECRVWNSNSIILCPTVGLWVPAEFFCVYNPVTCCKAVLVF